MFLNLNMINPANLVQLILTYYLIQETKLVTCLRLIMFDLPSPVMRGDSVELSCIYELENDRLYSVKWYKNNVEFYRFVPRDWPPGQFLPHKGIRVDLSRSGKNSVYLKDVDLNSTGIYRCEVSAEAPTFNTAEMEKEMKVYVLPSEGPKITGTRRKIKLGDTINPNCTSFKSKPASTLRWLINGNEVGTEYQTSHSTTLHEDGLESSHLGLKLLLKEEYFKNGLIRIKCTATISRIYIMSNEVTLHGDGLSHQSSRLHLSENLSQAVQPSSITNCFQQTSSLTLISITLLSFLLISQLTNS
ncbi:uncharacterized protein LOC128393051 [Panonychus citri]|uniref:uncharacterized protein LOC128393051 n=1 Tax=Panonychus citri TaxID=50023 RepID=UPI0023074EC6|nr:uncharacterized protein LOC128393051 [Panonychus citri]